MSVTTQEPRVGLDSQCLSFLLDAIAGIGEPTDPLVEERKALIRIWFYRPGGFYVTETVVEEAARIRDVERRRFHEDFVQTLFLDPPVRDRGALEIRVIELSASHPQVNDCRILAEAEELQLDSLLTYDREFRQRLTAASSTVNVVTPSAYWVSLNIAKGARPITVPHHTNPLSRQSWWRW